MSVAVAVGLLVVGLAYGTYTLGARLVARWQEDLYAQNALHLITQQFGRDVRSAQAVARVSPGRLELMGPARAPVVYRWEGGALWRNDVRMHPEAVQVVQASFRRASADSSVERRGEGDTSFQQGRPVQLVLELSIEVRGDTLRARVGAAIRQPAAWLAGSPQDIRSSAER